MAGGSSVRGRRRRLSEDAKTNADCFCGTDRCACAAADTFGRLGVLYGVNVHFADGGASAAADASAFIDGQAIEADLVEQAVDRAERTEDLAEEAIDRDAGGKREDK